LRGRRCRCHLQPAITADAALERRIGNETQKVAGKRRSVPAIAAGAALGQRRSAHRLPHASCVQAAPAVEQQLDGVLHTCVIGSMPRRESAASDQGRDMRLDQVELDDLLCRVPAAAQRPHALSAAGDCGKCVTRALLFPSRRGLLDGLSQPL
jgi:hypothetical protein